MFSQVGGAALWKISHDSGVLTGGLPNESRWPLGVSAGEGGPKTAGSGEWSSGLCAWDGEEVRVPRFAGPAQMAVTRSGCKWCAIRHCGISRLWPTPLSVSGTEADALRRYGEVTVWCPSRAWPSALRAMPLARVLMMSSLMKCGCVTSRLRPVCMCRTLTPPPHRYPPSWARGRNARGMA